VSMTLKQTGAKVTGNLDIAGRPDISGPVVGKVEAIRSSWSNGVVTAASPF